MYRFVGDRSAPQGELEIGKIWHMRSAARSTKKIPYGACRSKFGLSRSRSGRRMVWFSGKLWRNQRLLEVFAKFHIGVWCGKSACGVPRRAAQNKTSTLYYTTNGTQLSRGFYKKKMALAIFLITIQLEALPLGKVVFNRPSVVPLFYKTLFFV